MPYIDREQREWMEKVVREVTERISGGMTTGEFAYLLAKELQAFQQGQKFVDIALVVGVLETAKLEFVRRVLNPYEDAKREENGDVYP